MVAGVPEAADCRSAGVLERLFNLPLGGCVGALGPSAMFYIVPAQRFFLDFWQEAVDGTRDRVGDVYRQVLENHIQLYEPGSVPLSTLMCMTIWGDPALLFLPATPGGMDPTGGLDLVADASPNPFNPATEISFVLPGEAGSRMSTVVEIFDLAGRRLNRILADDLAPGAHSVRWRGRDAAGRAVGSGLFLARIQAGDLHTVVKLVLVE
jgi:hypothetical protein